MACPVSPHRPPAPADITAFKAIGTQSRSVCRHSIPIAAAPPCRLAVVQALIDNRQPDLATQLHAMHLPPRRTQQERSVAHFRAVATGLPGHLAQSILPAPPATVSVSAALADLQPSHQFRSKFRQLPFRAYQWVASAYVIDIKRGPRLIMRRTLPLCGRCAAAKYACRSGGQSHATAPSLPCRRLLARPLRSFARPTHSAWASSKEIRRHLDGSVRSHIPFGSCRGPRRQLDSEFSSGRCPRGRADTRRDIAFAFRDHGDQRNDVEGRHADDDRGAERGRRPAGPTVGSSGRGSGIGLAPVRGKGPGADRAGRGRCGLRLLDVGVPQIRAAGI